MAATTPEGRIKNQVKKVLGNYSNLWFNMPVPTGYGTPMLDFIGCYCGRGFAIETKVPGKKPTARQAAMIEDMSDAGMLVLVIDGPLGLETLRLLLDNMRDIQEG